MSNNKFMTVDLPGHQIEYPEHRLVNGNLNIIDLIEYCRENKEISDSYLNELHTFFLEHKNKAHSL